MLITHSTHSSGVIKASLYLSIMKRVTHFMNESIVQELSVRPNESVLFASYTFELWRHDSVGGDADLTDFK